MRAQNAAKSPTTSRRQKQGRVVADEASPSSSSDSSHGSPSSLTSTTSTTGCIGASPRVQASMRQFADHARASYLQGTPTLLHLPLLVKFNVSSALARNAEILGVTAEYFNWEGISPFNKQ